MINNLMLLILFNQGRICRFATGSLLAFLSGLTITLNNFVVKATRVNFGEILAIRCIVQIPVMLAYVLIRGKNKNITVTLRLKLFIATKSTFIFFIFKQVEKFGQVLIMRESWL